MKKKMFLVLFVFTIILSGCGNKVDYTDPQIYIDMLADKLNEVDSSYLENINELVDITGTSEQGKALVESYKGLIESVVNKIPDQVDNFYKGFEESVSTIDEGITSSSEELQIAIDQYNEAGEAIQTLYDKSLSAVLDVFSSVLDKISELIDSATEEDIKTIKDFGDLISKYQEQANTSIQEEIQSQIAA